MPLAKGSEIFPCFHIRLHLHTKHKYAFNPIVQLVKQHRDTSEYLLKLDNDLIFKSPLPDFKGKVAVWKHERIVKNGNPKWGEKLICQQVCHTQDFNIYNMGVLGLPNTFWEYFDDFLDTCDDMVNTDISGVTDVNSKIYHCCEQTAYNWIFHKYSLALQETYKTVDHYFSNKQGCISSAKFLLKRQT